MYKKTFLLLFFCKEKIFNKILSFLQKLQTIAEDFCGMDVNTPLGGELPVSAIPVLLFNTRLTAVAATSTGDFTVVFVGTATGHLKKVRGHN